MLKNLVKLSGGKCPENNYQGFIQKIGQCWIDSTSMALIYGGRTSNDIIHLITKGIKPDNSEDPEPNYTEYIKYRMRDHADMIPINIEERDYPDFISEANVFLKNIKARLTRTIQNTKEIKKGDSTEQLLQEMPEMVQTQSAAHS